MTAHASAPFEVRLTPQPAEYKADSSLARFSIDKQIHGDLEGTSKGQMLSTNTSVKGSAGYVSREHCEGAAAASPSSTVV